MISILRYEVPVDDQWHAVKLGGPIVHVAARLSHVVEIWAEDHKDSTLRRERLFRVYGTGQPCVEGVHVGTAITANGALVWHLREAS